MVSTSSAFPERSLSVEQGEYFRSMSFVFSFACGLFVCALIYRSRRKTWECVKEEAILNLKYHWIATLDLFHSYVHRKKNKIDLTPQDGKIAIVTGGSRGIGAVVVEMLLRCNMDVIIACRTPTAGEKTIESIRKSGVTTGRAKVYRLDNSSLESVREFAETIKKDYSKINILVNNAGIMFPPYAETEDGFEQQWGVNYLSHFLLTSLLLPLLKAGGKPGNKSRIINVTSCAHLLGNINYDDINYKNLFITEAAYAQSKLAQVIFTKMLQGVLKEKLVPVQTYCVHPGIVDTDLFVHSMISRYRFIFSHIFKTPLQGATPIVYAAVNPDIEERGGIYINDCIEVATHPQASDPSIQDRLFQLSLKQAQLKDFFEFV